MVEPKGVEAFAYLDDVIIGMVGVTSDTVDVVPFLQRELASIGIAMNPSITVALPPKGHVPSLEEIALPESVHVRIAERGGVSAVGVPIGTDAYAMESAMEIVKNVGAEQLARMLPHMPDKQSANLIATGSMVQRTAYIERVMDPELSLPACQKADNSAMRMLETCLISRGQQKNRRSSRTGARRVKLCCCPTNARRRACPRRLESLGCRRLEHGRCRHPSEHGGDGT